MGTTPGDTKEAEAAQPVPGRFTTLTCKFCRIEKSAKVTPKGEPRTPNGWHRQDEGRVCAECWKERYLLRAISIPVASPVDCSWNELRAALKTMWAARAKAFPSGVSWRPENTEIAWRVPRMKLRRSWPAMRSGDTFQMFALSTRNTHSAKIFHGSGSAN